MKFPVTPLGIILVAYPAYLTYENWHSIWYDYHPAFMMVGFLALSGNSFAAELKKLHWIHFALQVRKVSHCCCTILFGRFWSSHMRTNNGFEFCRLPTLFTPQCNVNISDPKFNDLIQAGDHRLENDVFIARVAEVFRIASDVRYHSILMPADTLIFQNFFNHAAVTPPKKCPLPSHTFTETL